jgi:hypothetical protein
MRKRFARLRPPDDNVETTPRSLSSRVFHAAPPAFARGAAIRLDCYFTIRVAVAERVTLPNVPVNVST